jgi:hypothetical protein
MGASSLIERTLHRSFYFRIDDVEDAPPDVDR